MNEPKPWACSSCGHDQRNIQLRMVSVNVGKSSLQTRGVAPVNSCQQCGVQQVDYKINIGELVPIGQAPSEAPPQTPPAEPSFAQLRKAKTRRKLHATDAAKKKASKKKARRKK